MTWTPTPDSSNISGFEYNNSTQVLTVEFKNGGRYNYYDVPEIVADRMNAAPSKGQFLAQNIKNTYRYARV
jgi:KTSC domain